MIAAPTSSVNRAAPGVEPTFEKPEYVDVCSDEYRDAVCKQLDGYRGSRYAHLCERQYKKLRAKIWCWAPYLHIEGAPSSTLSGPVFDIELIPNAKPVKHNLPKYSEEQKRKEKYHVDKAELLGHLRTPTQEQLSEWSTRTHCVYKKDDVMGRWICDLRDVNRSTIKTPIVLSDSHTLVRLLAHKKFKATFDAWAGFNQIKATDRASRRMQITTSLGLRQWTVMPFGVTNGPSCFQGIMMDHFVPLKVPLEKECNASLNFFFDDGALGSGTYTDPDSDDDATNGFDEHLRALGLVFKKSAEINLRFKLSKCFFFQLAVPILGEVAGLGTVTADPAKTDAIRNWPRPSKVEDVERFLCTLGFFRQHITPRFSEISLPLRECMYELHKARAEGKYRKIVRGKDPHVKNRHGDAGEGWPDFWSQACEDAFESLKKSATEAVNLSVPDLVGAHDGTNPFLLYPDACKYGVGAGLFQASPVSPELRDSHYAVLGIPTWSTKQAVERRYQELKKLCVTHTRNLDRMTRI